MYVYIYIYIYYEYDWRLRNSPGKFQPKPSFPASDDDAADQTFSHGVMQNCLEKRGRQATNVQWIQWSM